MFAYTVKGRQTERSQFRRSLRLNRSMGDHPTWRNSSLKSLAVFRASVQSYACAATRICWSRGSRPGSRGPDSWSGAFSTV